MLDLLAGEPMSGYDLAKFFGVSMGNVWPAQHSQIYPELVVVVDNSIVNVALPTLVRDLHASTTSLQWVTDAYTLAMAGLLLTLGSVGDRIGRHRTLAGGLVVFGLGSAFAGISASAPELIACRVLMGIGAAAIMPATLSILTNVFTAPSERARAIAIWSAVTGLGVAIGPTLGGWLLEHFGWDRSSS